MKYIITNGEKYLKQNPQAGYLVVDNFSDASIWQVKEKANNVIKTCPLCRTYDMETIELTTNDIEDTPINYDLEEKIGEIERFTEQLQSRRIILLKLIQREDLKIVDIEHVAEFKNLGAAAGYKIYKLLHDCKCRRRDYKNELRQIDGILGKTLNAKGIICMKKAIKSVQEQKYEPRILKELFQ
jgi:hypothetical protein